MTNEAKAQVARRIILCLRRLAGPVLLERILVAGCRSGFAGRFLKVGAGVDAYRRTVSEDESRLAVMEGYSLWVHIAEIIGAGHYFWGRHMASAPFWPLVPTGSVVMDVGSNMGSWAFWAAWKSGPSGKVFAFEPNPRNQQLIRRSIEANGFQGRIHLDPRAVANESGQFLRFHLSNDPGNSGTCSLDFDPELLDRARFLEVETVTFCDFCREKGLERVDFAKIDVERAELQVLLGMKRMLEDYRVDRLLVELFTGSEAHRLLTGIGYTAYAGDPATNRFVPATGLPDGRFTDLLFVRPGLGPTPDAGGAAF